MKRKLYCIFARESVAKMKGVRGKICSQAGHAFLHAVWDAERRFPDHVPLYRESAHAFKITLIVESVEELRKLEETYRDQCGVSLVKDSAFTVLDEPTVTCLGLGPIAEDLVGDDLKSLPLFI